jgi:hypothetical protein
MNVDVIYQGLALVRGASARLEGGGLFVELEAPMPVGTPLELVTPEGTRTGRVESVVEGAGAGMLVWFGGKKTAEPNAPMQEMKSAPPLQMPPVEAAPAGDGTPAAASADDDEAAENDDKPDNGGKPDDGKKKKRRQRKTVIGH